MGEPPSREGGCGALPQHWSRWLQGGRIPIEVGVFWIELVECVESEERPLHVHLEHILDLASHHQVHVFIELSSQVPIHHIGDLFAFVCKWIGLIGGDLIPVPY